MSERNLNRLDKNFNLWEYKLNLELIICSFVYVFCAYITDKFILPDVFRNIKPDYFLDTNIQKDCDLVFYGILVWVGARGFLKFELRYLAVFLALVLTPVVFNIFTVLFTLLCSYFQHFN